MILMLLSATSLLWGEDWPRFRGPHGDCSSQETDLLTSWPAKGLNVLWTADLGPGFGGPVAHGGKVYLLDRVAGEKDILRCWDLQTGRQQWSFAYEAPGEISHHGSRSHPTVTDSHVYILGPYGDLHCLSKKTHRPVWKNNIRKSFEASQPNWAFCQAAVLYKDKLIVAPIGKETGVVALRQTDGSVVWKSPPVEGGISYATCTLTAIDGVNQVLVVTTSHLVGVNADDGTILWKTGDWTCGIPIASATPLGQGRVFISGGYNSGAALFQVSRQSNQFSVSTLFKTKACNGQIHQPLLYEGHLYLNGNDKSKRYGFICMDLEGNLKWQTGKDPGFDWGGYLLADKRIYVVDGAKGDLCMLEPDPDGYKELARFHLLGGEKLWASIALSDGKILLRDQQQLKCVDVKSVSF
jgi:outer membrane protein assembly factor BamB